MKRDDMKKETVNRLLDEGISRFLSEKEFLNIATCDYEHRPNVAPKFLLKIEGDCIYLADYILGRTWRNIKINSKVSLSTVDFGTLIGYQMNGLAEIIEEGDEYSRLMEEVHARTVHFSVKRVIEAVQTEKKSKQHEVVFPEHIVIFKIKIMEVVEIAPSGKLERKKAEG